MINLKDHYHELFATCKAAIAAEVAELDNGYELARNLACSGWRETIAGYQPTTVYPERMDLLKANYEQLRRQLSFKRYLLIELFSQHMDQLAEDDLLCRNHWKSELKKKNPEIGHTNTVE